MKRPCATPDCNGVVVRPGNDFCATCVRRRQHDLSRLAEYRRYVQSYPDVLHTYQRLASSYMRPGYRVVPYA